MQVESFRTVPEINLAPWKFPGEKNPAIGTHDSVAGFPASNEVGTLRILVAAGGTGGHIFPARAVAEELRHRRTAVANFQFLGTARGLETRLIDGAGFPYRALAAAGL